MSFAIESGSGRLPEADSCKYRGTQPGVRQVLINLKIEHLPRVLELLTRELIEGCDGACEDVPDPTTALKRALFAYEVSLSTICDYI